MTVKEFLESSNENINYDGFDIVRKNNAIAYIPVRNLDELKKSYGNRTLLAHNARTDVYSYYNQKTVRILKLEIK